MTTGSVSTARVLASRTPEFASKLCTYTPQRAHLAVFTLLVHAHRSDGHADSLRFPVAAVRFTYEYQHAETGQWYRCHGNELWQFDNKGYMQHRDMSGNDVSAQRHALCRQTSHRNPEPQPSSKHRLAGLHPRRICHSRHRSSEREHSIRGHAWRHDERKAVTRCN
eukprot:3275352-Rhodomonas_salina.1